MGFPSITSLEKQDPRTGFRLFPGAGVEYADCRDHRHREDPSYLFSRCGLAFVRASWPLRFFLSASGRKWRCFEDCSLEAFSSLKNVRRISTFLLGSLLRLVLSARFVRIWPLVNLWSGWGGGTNADVGRIQGGKMILELLFEGIGDGAGLAHRLLDCHHEIKFGH